MVQKVEEEKILSLLKSGESSEIDLRFSSGISKDRLFTVLAEMTAAGSIRFTGRRVRGSRVFELTKE
jgi:hypothetical protein